MTSRSLLLRRPLVTSLGLLWLASAALAQQGGAPGAGVDREAMWPAPTAEDWARPVLVRFERTWDDAVAVARETSRPILACINMDGEVASEHYAGVRYREPAIAALYEPYVCVIASVYRHNPRDFDEAGRRIECPRFGGVTCGEHIAIEPVLHERFMDGRRIAPRHIMVELDGSETFDVYYAWDTASVFGAIRKGIAEREIEPIFIARGDRSLEQRVASRHAGDREAMEASYRDGDVERRRILLRAAASARDVTPVDMLRLAVFGDDPELARAARAILAEAQTPETIDLIVAALRTAMADEERQALVAALVRLGDASPRARTLAVVQRGLAGRSRAIDVDGWTSAMQGGATYPAAPGTAAVGAAGAPGAAADGDGVAARLRRQDEVLASRDSGAHVELAESFLEYAYEHFESEPDYARLLFMDARNTATEAESLGATGWRVDAALAIADYYLGDVEAAHRRAEAAVATGIPDDALGWNAMAVVAIFVQARQEAIQAALRAGTDWPSQWLTDVRAAYEVLARHPFGTDEQVAAHYDFLNGLGGAHLTRAVLDDGLRRFPASPLLHDRLRLRILWERGVDAIEPAYERMLAADAADAALRWFAGVASVSVAEQRRRDGRPDDAVAAYDRAVVHFEHHLLADADARERVDGQVALALAGRARVAYERGDDTGAVADLVAALRRRPEAAAQPDGLNVSPADTARVLRARLIRRARADLLESLDAALFDLDRDLLRLPDYERQLPPERPRDTGMTPRNGSDVMRG